MNNLIKLNKFLFKTFISIILFLFLITQHNICLSQSNTRVTVRGTGYPVPRFVSIKNDEAWLRKGPSRSHKIEWVYKISGLPLKIVAEFDEWRKVMDSSGSIGWMHRINLSSKRTAEITKTNTNLYESPNLNSKIIAYTEDGAILNLIRCKNNWCRLKYKNLSGWVTKDKLYGVMENEKFE